MSNPHEELDLGLDRAHGARIYDYILGGKDNYEMDRQAGNASLKERPAMGISMRANRAFMHRVGRFLAAQRGIRQFLDIGTGIPTKPNLHEVVQAVAPEARIVYVDNDPIVLAHARALMTSTREGRTAYINADMRDPDAILDAPELRETLDLDQPIGLTLIAMLHFIEDDEEAYRVVRRVVNVLPSGSFFAVIIATDEFAPEPLAGVREQYHAHGETLKFRTKAQALQFFECLELEEPGLVQIHKWRPDPACIGRIDDTTSRCTGRSVASYERHSLGGRRFHDAAHHVHAAGVNLGDLVPRDLHPRLWPPAPQPRAPAAYPHAQTTEEQHNG